MLTDQRIDELCSRTRNAEVLNALHACRTDSALGRRNPYRWRNAWAMVRQRASDFAGCNTAWLADAARDEHGEADSLDHADSRARG